MVKLIKILLCGSVFSVGLLSNANAALETRLGGLAVYDTDIDITWLTDADYAKTSGYDADGLMNWYDANTWAASLNISGTSNWRLPEVNEMIHLYNVEDISIFSPNLFVNIHFFSYWTATEFEHIPLNAWFFGMVHGLYDWTTKNAALPAWAVHDGDVGAGLVPEPKTYAMMSIGLLMLFGFRRLKQC